LRLGRHGGSASAVLGEKVPCAGETDLPDAAPLTRPSGIGQPAGVACFPVIERLARLRGRRRAYLSRVAMTSRVDCPCRLSL
jgi:hypothetical protein